MSGKEPDKKPDSKKPPKRRKAVLGRRSGSRPKALYQQEPEPELDDEGKPRPKGSGGAF